MYNNFIIEKAKNLIKKIIRDSSLYSERESEPSSSAY